MAAPHQAPGQKVDPFNNASLQEKFGTNQDELKGDNINHERNELLANLPDPDEGKSEEERRKIDRKLMWKVGCSGP